MKHRFVSTTLAFALFAVTAVAEATPIVNATGLASPTQTVTFSELAFAQGTQISNQFAAFGVTFSPALQYNSQGAVPFPGFNADYLGNNGPCCDNPFSIFFGTPVSAAAFGFASNPANTLVEALLLGGVVESFVQATSFDVPGTAFLGFSGILFDQIRVTVGGDTQGLIDNIQTTAVPEPASLLLLGTGLAAIARRRLARRG